MKNYLKILREKLLNSKKDVSSNRKSILEQKVKDDAELTAISEKLGIEIVNHSLKKLLSVNGQDGYNAYLVDKNNLVYFFPLNDSLASWTIDYYKGGKLVFSNRETYSEITNLDEILLQMVRVFNNALTHEIVINPYGFMLKLKGEVSKSYQGEAYLLINSSSIMRRNVNIEDYSQAFRSYINIFLDYFIGRNFGVSVNRSEILRKELETLNQKVIDAGIRENIKPGFELYGSEDKVRHGLQHYKLPTGSVLTKNGN